MKKKLLIGLGIVAGVAAAGGLGLYLYIQSLLPAKEERLNFRSDRVIQTIDRQLEGIDQAAVKAKSNLIAQKSLAEIKANLADHKLTHEELVAYYLLRIKELDQAKDGMNAISEVNPDAMKEARRYDEMDSSEESLAGIPVVVKENINTNNMPTSAGSYALRDFIPAEDAPAVKQLKAEGAVILGKTNLSEMSHWMSQKNPSGYSAKKGQTHNPFGPLKISASGSSTGSAVAMATDMATLSLGTETAGSIVSPASMNSVVGFKPTRGNISGEAVIPITHSLDTVGAITKTVEDAYATYQAAAEKPLENLEFTADYLKGKRIGVMESAMNKAFTTDVTKALEKAGAEVKVVKVNSDDIDTGFILKSDFETDLNAYLSTYKAPIKDLAALIAYNKENKEERMRYGQSHLEESLNFKEKDDKKVAQYVKTAQDRLTKLLADEKLDAIVYKENDGVGLTAVAGAPQVAVPFGMKDGSPVGATFVTDRNQDAEALKLAYGFEQATQARQIAKGYE